MNKYLATITLKGQSIKTVVFADSAIHARLILEYQFGMNCILSSPIATTKESSGGISIEEALQMIKPLKPMTPQQLTIDTLKKQKDQANNRLKAERNRQKIAKAQKSLFNLSR
jgi:hypothetical protein